MILEDQVNELTLKTALGDRIIDVDKIPWVPQSEGVWFKPLRFDLSSGAWVNILKVEPRGTLTRHRHTGGSVLAYTLQGQWRYLERSWVAKAGSFIFEPPGDIHTLVVEGDKEMITLFYLQGAVQYFNKNDEIIYQDDLFTKMSRYHNHCNENKIPIVDLCF